MKNISKILFFLLILFPFSVLSKEEEKIDIKLITQMQNSGFVGESLSYSLLLMSNTPEIADVRIVGSPSLPAELKVINGVIRNNRPEKKEIKGKLYYCWTILRKFIIPSKPGKYSIGNYKLIAFVPHEKIVYNQFWGNRRVVEYEEISIESDLTNFKVNDLPKLSANLSFSGGVGDFKIDGWFPPGKIYKGKESYVVFTISGYGCADNLVIPNIYKIFNKHCYLKEVEQEEEQMQRDGKLYSEVTLTCKFVPEEDEFEIDPLCLVFFNPARKSFQTVCSEKLHWTSKLSTQPSTSDQDAIAI